MENKKRPPLLSHHWMDRLFLNLAKIDFTCPHCNKKYKDDEDKYLDRCNKKNI